MISWHVGLALALLSMSGCAVSHLSPNDPIGLIPDRSSQIAVGQTDHTGVRGVLGTPQLSSAYWGFDLFRTETEQTETMYAVTPWPIPFARITDRLQRYTLVDYDEGGRASAVASGLFRKPAAWRNVSPITHDFPSLHLRAGEVMFFVDPEGARDVNLLASPRRRDTFLQHARSSSRCTVVLGCGNQGCPDQVSVDDAPIQRLPLRTAHGYWLNEAERDAWLQNINPHGDDPRMPWLEAVVALRLASGSHTLEFSAKHLGGKGSFNLACHPGEVSYVAVGAVSNTSIWSPTLGDWRFEQTEAMPPLFTHRPLVLMDDGRWYIDPEANE